MADTLGTLVLVGLAVGPPLAVVAGVVYLLRRNRTQVSAFRGDDATDDALRTRHRSRSWLGSLIERAIEGTRTAGQRRLDDDDYEE
jgi:hypothetical protein